MSDITKHALAASLKKLLAKKPIDKITVKDIVEDCGVNRHTFYYHFQDIYELIEWFCYDEAEHIIGSHKTFDTWKTGFHDLYVYLQQNRDIVMNAYNSNYRNYLEKYIVSLVRPYIADFLRIQSEGMNLTEEKIDFIADTYTFGIVSLSMDWIANEMSERYGNSMPFFLELLDGSMKHTLEKIAGEANDDGNDPDGAK